MSSDVPVEEPSSLSIEELLELFEQAKQLDYTDETLRAYKQRLIRFVDWCEEQEDIQQAGDLTGWHLEQFKLFRQGQDLAPTTIKGQMTTLKAFLDYAAGIEAVDEMLPYKVNIPKLEQAEETDDTILEPDRAKALLEHYRSARVAYATFEHTALELAWYTGARLGALRALDLEDYKPDKQIVWFRHRPDGDGTPLKKKQHGERPVGLPEPVCEVLDVFVRERRYDKRDGDGRQPLLCARQGRPATSTIQGWIYQATLPCVYRPCPHGNERRTCDFTRRDTASQCPSSRSPHQVRSGSITWQLNRGLSFEAVGERVNSDPDTLRRYYDKASEEQKLEERRRQFVDKLGFEE
jgi:integrase